MTRKTDLYVRIFAATSVVVSLMCSLGCATNKSVSSNLSDTVRTKLAKADDLPPNETRESVFDEIYELGPDALGICAVVAMRSANESMRMTAVEVLRWSDDRDIAIPLLSSVIQYDESLPSEYAFDLAGHSLTDPTRVAAHDHIFAIALELVGTDRHISGTAMRYLGAYGGDRAVAALRSLAEDSEMKTYWRIEAISYGYEIGGLEEVTQWDIDWIAIADYRNGELSGRDDPVIREILDFLSIE